MARDKLFFRSGRLVKAGSQTKTEKSDRAEASEWHFIAGSSNVKALRWVEGDGDKTGLGVWFAPTKDGKATGPETVYYYPSAPFRIYLKVSGAPSKGKALHEFVIDKYPHTGPFKP